MRRTAYALGAAILCLVWACEDTTNDPHPELVQEAGSSGNAGAAGGAAGSGAKATHIDRSALSNVGTDKPLDYSDPRLWLCRPGNDPDECDINQDATELLADGSRKLVKHQKAEDPKFDCFYVYPTVKLTSEGPMTDFSDVSITLDPLLNQAARFNRICRVYAPLYRQNGVVPGAGGAPTMGSTGFDLGLQDVRDAFKYYVEHLSQGRKFVLMGHSQGTGMLTSTIAMDVDPKPELREQMLSALLLGGGVLVPEGKAVGGTFKNIPICEQPGQTGCALTYVSYSQEVPPTSMSTFGRSTTEGQVVACTEPAALAGRAGAKYRGSYAARTHVNPGLAPDGIEMLPTDVTTPYFVFREVLRGQCQNKNGASYLEISLDRPADDKRPLPPYRKPAIEAALGLHLVDYTVELDDLIDAVELQGKTIK
jgi:hypothetical protein